MKPLLLFLIYIYTGVEEHIWIWGTLKEGSGVQPPEADFIECLLTLTGQVITHVTMNLINAYNHGYTCLYTMNVANTQLPQLYYNYNECFSLFSIYYILQCKHFGEGDNEHVVILGGKCPWCPIGPSTTLYIYIYIYTAFILIAFYWF